MYLKKSRKYQIGRESLIKGSSTRAGTKYGNFIKGNKDKLMISYLRDQTLDYAMAGTCGVVYQGRESLISPFLGSCNSQLVSKNWH